MLNFDEITIDNITNEQVEELANEIFDADDAADHGHTSDYTVTEINTKLVELGVADKDGCFLLDKNLSGRALEVSNMLSDLIG